MKYFQCPKWALTFLISSFSVLNGFSQLNGIYTIDQTASLTPTNFHSIDSAFQTLADSGISGAVTLNIVANSGPYLERAILDSVTGVSSLNTITIKGNGNTMADSGTDEIRHIIQIRGTNHVIIDSLTIKCLGPEFGTGIHFMDAADYNTVKNCTFDMSALSSNVSFSSAAIAYSQDTNDIYVQGNSGNYGTIENNTIIANTRGAHYGFILTGSVIQQIKGHVIKNNILSGIDLVGINLRYCDSGLVYGNDISRPNSVVTGNFAGIQLNLGCENFRIEKNRIHNTNGAGMVTTAYGVIISYCDASSGNENTIINNLLYDFNTNGSAYPLFSNNSSGNHFYYNTVSLDYVDAVSGNARGFYQTGTESNIIFKNNLISITKGGSGTKYGIYFGTTFSSVDSDYNIIYLNSLGSGDQVIGRWSTDHTSLNDWQLANSGAYDQNSIAVNPGFSDIDSTLIPSNSLADNVATPISGITTDFLGATRDTLNPDAGAIEFSPDSLDATVLNIEGLIGICPTISPVSTQIMNLGISTVTSLTINWRVNGVLQSPVSYTDTLNPGQSDTITLGSVNVLAGIDYEIDVWTSAPNGGTDDNPSNDSLSVGNRGAGLSGSYAVGSTGDYPTPEVAVNAMNERGICGPVTLNIDSSSGPYEGRMYLLNIEGNSATNTITINGNGATVSYITSSSYPAVIFLESIQYCTIDNLHIIAENTNDAMGIYLADSSDHNTIKNCEIEIWSTNTFQISAGIHVSSPTSYYLDGYNANHLTIEDNWIHAGVSSLSGPSYGIKLYGGNNGLQGQNNIIRNNKIDDFHFAGIFATEQQGLVIEGNEISRPNRTNSFSGVYGIHLSDTSQNCSILRNEIHDFFQSSTSSSSIGIYIDQVDANSGNETIVVNNLLYNINEGSNGMTGISNFGSDGCMIHYNTIYADNTSGPASSIYGINQSLTATNVSVKNNLIYLKSGSFGTLYGLRYGTNSSTITSDHNNVFLSSTGATRRYGVWGFTQYTTLANWKTANSGAFDANSHDLDPSFTNPTSEDFVPTSLSLNNQGTPISGITDDFYESLRSSTVPDIGAIEFPRTLHDAGVLEISGLDNPCPGNVNVWAKVVNFGSNTIEQVTVNWSVNGVNQTSVLDTSDILSGDTATILLGSIAMTAINMYDVVSWTSGPNNQVDPTNNNDTAKVLGKETAFSGAYTIGASGDFISFVSAANALNSRGMCGPVVLNLDPSSGPYVGRTILGPVFGNSDVNTITINGNGATISAPTSFSFPYVFVMDGIVHSVVDSLTIEASGSSYGLGLILTNQADHNTIQNCTIDISNPYSTFIGATAGIIASASITGTTQGNNANYVTIKNNTILGGTSGGPYRAITFLGSNQDTLKGIEIVDNTIIDPYQSGVYLVFCDSAIVSGNDISRPNFTNPSSFHGVYIGVGNTRCIIEKNLIHNPFGNSTTLLSSNAFYHAANAPVGRENIIANNLFYDVTGGGRVFGVYMSASWGLKVYNNTFSIDDTTTSSSFIWNTGGLFVNQFSDSVTFENNIVSITRKGDSDGYGIYAESNAHIISNRNVYYINGGDTNHIAHYNGNDYSTLQSWRTVSNGAFDQQSIEVNPDYLNIANDDYTPTNVIADGLALPVTGITDDLFGQARSTINPDPGAIEFLSNSNYANDDCASAVPITFGLTIGSTLNATPDTAPACVTTSGSDGGVWYTIIGNGNYYIASLCSSTYDTRLRVFSGSCNNLICETGNEDSCSTRSVAGWCSEDSVEYYLLVHGNAEEGHFFLEMAEEPLTAPIVSFVNDSSFCAGDSVEIIASAGSYYLWNNANASTTQSIYVKDSSGYSVLVEDSLGCQSTSAAIYATVMALPDVFLGNDTTICIENNASLTLNAGSGSAFLWNTGDITSSITVNSSTLGVGVHNFSVDVTDGNGCVGTDDILVTVDECFVGISEMEILNELKIYPNPVENELILESASQLKNITLRFMDAQGKIVLEITSQLLEGSNKIDVTALSAGQYLLQIQSDQQQITKKLSVH